MTEPYVPSGTGVSWRRAMAGTSRPMSRARPLQRVGHVLGVLAALDRHVGGDEHLARPEVHGLRLATPEIPGTCTSRRRSAST